MFRNTVHVNIITATRRYHAIAPGLFGDHQAPGLRVGSSWAISCCGVDTSVPQELNRGEAPVSYVFGQFHVMSCDVDVRSFPTIPNAGILKVNGYNYDDYVHTFSTYNLIIMGILIITAGSAGLVQDAGQGSCVPQKSTAAGGSRRR